jgi:uncharacterized repeat protein (TIGR01451 family)
MRLKGNPGGSRGRMRDVALLLVMVGALTALVAGALPAGAAIPAAFTVVKDQNGPNDVPGQQDLTQLGRDDSDPTVYRLFWSWDDTADWQSSGNTGDACALFDKNNDGLTDFEVCGEIFNPTATTVTQTGASPVAYSCTPQNAQAADRCQGAAPVAITPSDVQAGMLTTPPASPAASPPGNLITNTDPFAGGGNFPNDSTLEVVIRKGFLPAGAVLTNVCAHTSIANGAGNNPTDCITPSTPSGFLVIKKDAGSDTSTPFVFTPNPAGPQSTITVNGTSQSSPTSVPLGTSEIVTETVPANWTLTAGSCKLADGTTSTGTFSAANHEITGITIQSGLITTCSFTDVNKPALTVTKDNDADHNGNFNDIETVPPGATYPYTVTYRATIHNGAASPATISAITDNVVPAPLRSASTTDTDCADVIGTTIAAGATVTCFYDKTFADAGQAQVVNTVSVTATNAAGNDTKTDTSTVNFSQVRSLALTKSATPTTYSNVGQTIGYSYVVTNTGNVPFAGPVTVTDDKAATVTCPSGALALGASITCTASYSITQADINAGSVTNTAQAHANGVNSNTAQATVLAVAAPALTLVKSASPGTYSAVGTPISYSYLVTNNGNVRLAGPVTVADNKVSVSCPALTTVGNHDTFLDPGESVTCTASYSITQADLDSGSVTNTAKASAGGTDSNTDTQTVHAIQSPALSLKKSATPSTYDHVGQTISYSYVVKNTGNVTLAGPVTVTDDKAAVSCPGGSLAPNAMITCMASYAITQADLNSGSVTNTAQAHANGTDSNTDHATVTAQQHPALSLVKSAAPSTYDETGQVISYTYDVTNTGNVSLAGPVTVSDDKATVTCPDVSTVGNDDGLLDPNESLTCTASYTITQADLNNGSVTNTATAHAGATDSNTDHATVTAVPNPELKLVKHASPTVYDHVGQLISYSYDVSNTGNVSLAGPVTVLDDKATVTCPDVSTVGNHDSFFDPGEQITCTASYSITQADLNSGSVTNTAQAQAGGTSSNTDSKTVTAQQHPALSLVKSASPANYDHVGQTISYSYLVTNMGNVSLPGPVTVSDDKATVACPDLSTVGNHDASLDPGESVTCTASYSITQADLNSGSVTNTATAHAGGTDSNQDSKTVTAQQHPALTLAKSATPSTYDHVGQTISYTYVVTNSGNVSLPGPVTVTDDKATVSCPDLSTVGNHDASFDPGEQVTCTASYSITQADLNSGSVTNTAKAHAGGTDSNTDHATVTAQQNPALTLAKSATPSTYDHVGQAISYTYLVTNSGNVRLAGPVTVSDDKATVSCPDVSTTGNGDSFLDPGESVTCTATYSITQADLNSGSVTNHAQAHAGGTDSNTDHATVTAQQNPALSLAKSATPSSYDHVGQMISYSYLVKNTGNVSLAGPVTVTDDKATVSCPDLSTVGNHDSSFDPGEQVTCTASYSITQADLNSGHVTNSATAHAGGTDSNEDHKTVTADQHPALTLVKTATPSTYDHVGQTISYSYAVENTGNVSLAGPVTVTDDKATVMCPDLSTVGNHDSSFDPGEQVTCTASYSITQADLNSGSVTNTATAHAGATDSNQDHQTVTAQQHPALTMAKHATPGTYDHVGQVISYTYVVENTGNVSLAGPVTVSDDKATVTCPDVSTVGNDDALLDPGESVTCTASYSIEQADLNSGSVTNSATAHAGGTDSNEDHQTVTADQHPALSLVKSASPPTYDHVGQVIAYSYLVTNTGNVSLAGPVTVGDNKVTVTCPPLSSVGNNDSSLDPGESVTCTASYSITQADLNSGSVTNIATAHAGGTDSNTDTKTVTAQQHPALTLVKSASPSSYDHVGQVISYAYLVTNTGNVSLAGPVTVNDDKAMVACPDVSTVGNHDSLLDPGEAVTCTASYTTTQADLNGGSVTNTARAHAGGTDSNQDSKTVTADQHPALTLAKSASPATYNAVAQVISYSYLVTNTGNVSLAGPVTVNDDKATVSCPDLSAVGNHDGLLDPNESVTCTASYSITQADINNGHVTNTATAHAGGTDSNTDHATVNAVQSPALALVKSASPSAYNTVGQTISYSYLVTNTGNVSLAGPVTVNDNKASVNCPNVNTVGNLDGFLDPGESITCTASYSITQADINNGHVTNTATAHAGGTDSNPDSKTVNAVQSPALLLAKSASPLTYDHVGQTIAYSYLVTNTGNVSLAGPVTVSDNKATVTCPPLSGIGNHDSSLDPGEQVTCTASYSITQADLNSGSVTNTATAHAGGTDSNTDSKTVTAQQHPGLTLVKSASPSTYSTVGQVISYSYMVTNTGNVSLAGPVTVTDNKATVTCPPLSGIGNHDGFLDPGESVTCTATYTITQADLNSGSVTNVAKAHAGGTDSNQDSKTVTAQQSPALLLAKSASPTTYNAVGQTISYGYLVTNSGNVSLPGPVTVTDNKTTVTCPSVNTVGNLDGLLDPGESITCSASYSITQADLNAGHVTNTAQAHAGSTNSNQDSRTVNAVQSPVLLLAKSASPTTYNAVGQTISYSYLVTNTGNVSLPGPVTVTDNKATVTCPNVNTVGNHDTLLDPGESITCTASHSITQADLDAGSLTNTAQAHAGSTNSNQDSRTVTAVQSPALQLTKTANPATYFQAGQVISYTYTLKNTGNVTLKAPFAVTDDKTTVTCPSTPTSIAPGATITCTGTYTIVAGDLNASNTGTVTNHATATAKDTNNNTVTSNQATATVRQIALTAQITPTATTCTDFTTGVAQTLDALGYGVQKGAINSVSPGVLFYYTAIKAPATSFSITVTETNNAGWKAMGVQQGQAILYNANCAKSGSQGKTSTDNSGVTTIQVTNATVGAIYIVGIKYSPNDIAGQKVSSPFPTATYNWITALPGNGGTIAQSTDNVTVSPR